MADLMFENISGRTWHKRVQDKWNVDKPALSRAFKHFRDKHGYDIRYPDCFERFSGSNNLLHQSQPRSQSTSRSQAPQSSSSSQGMSFSLDRRNKEEKSQQSGDDESSDDEEASCNSASPVKESGKKRKRGRNYSFKSLSVLNDAVKEYMPFLGT